MSGRDAGWRGTARIVAASALLVLLVQGATMLALRVPLERHLLPALALVAAGGVLLLTLAGVWLARALPPPLESDATVDDPGDRLPSAGTDPVGDRGAAAALAVELRRAIDGGELRLFLQPKVSLADTGVVGAEALVRWMHPQRGLLQPMDFVPLAAQCGLVRDLTQWVFDDAARRWEALRGDGAPLRIAVNLSVHDLLDPQLPDRLEAVLDRHQVPPQAFCLEVTEDAISVDPPRAEATLRRLAERGFKLSIDDFGTGVSSLDVLSRLPVHELKIDHTFVTTLERDPRHATLVRSAIQLAHGLGLRVVAEGVESAALWMRLRDWGCDEGQGFHMSRPLPADELPAWSRRWRQQQAGDLKTPPVAA